MNIICLSCGHKIDLGDDYDNYEGPVKCWVCTKMLKIKTNKGNLATVQLVDNPVSTPTFDEDEG